MTPPSEGRREQRYHVVPTRAALLSKGQTPRFGMVEDREDPGTTVFTDSLEKCYAVASALNALAAPDAAREKLTPERIDEIKRNLEAQIPAQRAFEQTMKAAGKVTQAALQYEVGATSPVAALPAENHGHAEQAETAYRLAVLIDGKRADSVNGAIVLSADTAGDIQVALENGAGAHALLATPAPSGEDGNVWSLPSPPSQHDYQPRDCGGACDVCGCEKSAHRAPASAGGTT